MSKASQDSVEALHGAFADYLTNGLESLKGKDPLEDKVAAFLNVVRGFLKDQGVQAIPKSPRGADNKTPGERLSAILENTPMDDLPYGYS